MYSDITLVSITAMSTRKLQHQLQQQEEAAKEKEDRHECDILVSKCERILTIPDTKILTIEDQQKAVSLTTITTTTSDHSKLVDFSKRIALPPLSSANTEVEGEDENENEDEPTTPRSVECRIPEIRPCPPAPKKPKTQPIRQRKCSEITHVEGANNNSSNEVTVSNIRSVNSASRLLDFSREVEALFPPRVRADLRRKIKKARSV